MLQFFGFVKRRVDRVEVFGVEVILRDANGIAKTINMKYYIFHSISSLSSLARITLMRTSTTAILSGTSSSSHLDI